MFDFILLVASFATLSFGSVANVCIQEPFREMQSFRDFGAAIDVCAVHYPIPTIVKTLANTCLTTTKTEVVGVSTVFVTNNLPCPTDIHLDMRDGIDEEVLAKRDAEAIEARDPKTTTRTRTRTVDRTRTRTRMRTHEKSRHTGEYYKTKIFTTTKTKMTTKTETRTKPPPSQAPLMKRADVRDAGPIKMTQMKRDAVATKSAAWSAYYGNLVNCGYSCLQSACSCVGSPVVQLHTPTPTCTITKTTSAVLHMTETVEVEPTQCF